MRKAVFSRFAMLDYACTEAINTICTNLSFAGRDVRKIVVTSSAAHEGKSFVTMQIAANLGKRGKRIAVVDADLRRSELIKRHGVRIEGEATGLAHYLVGYSSLADVLYETNLEGVDFIPIGRYVADPLPLLDSDEFSQMLDQLAEHYDLVLVDAPPVGVVIDAAEIGRVCDGALFITEFNKTRRRDLLQNKRQMEQSGCRVLGCVINKVEMNSLSAKKYYYSHYYSHYNQYYGKR